MNNNTLKTNKGKYRILKMLKDENIIGFSGNTLIRLNEFGSRYTVGRLRELTYIFLNNQKNSEKAYVIIGEGLLSLAIQRKVISNRKIYE